MTSAIRAFDRAQDAYNLAKKDAVQTKTVVFCIQDSKAGPCPIEIPFPHSGYLREVRVSCVTAGSTRTTLRLEKCNEIAYTSEPLWTGAADNIVIAAKERSNLLTRQQVTLYPQIQEGDFLRVNFVEAGNGAANFTLECVIEI